MSSGSLLLLLGLLTLWAELTPVSGQKRPSLCYLPADSGPCLAYMPRFYYNSTSHECQGFIYGGCRGNANNFETIDECHRTCVALPTRRPTRIGTTVRP
ncbi:kunitz-type serine protease inhibitor bitisilin-1-like [Ahaetulla prasina]|uniref:kunitz-type serine protease inhibitor bitisilin-1-like n=1 Tax=Ahaetulla prasina TaxID=499056 RepID=UPI002648B956|nr:kunitz-type serine protease inhibitor bitisilin-1-like [Ahaetulla prasina]